MRSTWKQWVMAMVMAWGIPWLVVAALRLENTPAPDTPEGETTAATADPTQPRREMLIRVIRSGTETQMPLEEYLVGVVLGEMPGSFHPEAKKAQAVVARTYTLRTAAYKQTHPGAVCTDSTCCQAYTDPEGYLRSGGSQEIVSQAREAVDSTCGLVLTYEGELIDATYFSCSGGATEDAVAVWGADVPYLQSVESPGEEIASGFTATVRFTPEDFRSALGGTWKGSAEHWLGPVTYTQGGGVDTMVIGGETYEGTQLRSLLGLRSTVFTARVENGQIVITTKGHGHRVGMSQYGAQAMALDGSNFPAILAHYYTGTVLETCDKFLA